MDPSTPEGLGAAGTALYEKILAELPHGVEYDPREMELLVQAAVCADTIAALDEVVARDGPTTTGSTGQTVVHPAIQEARMQRVVLLRLLTAVDLPEEEAVEAPTRGRARHAANARWQQGRTTQLRRGA